jgi:hypothetical protein
MADNTVYIERCKNCKSHAWCTIHNEAKYQEFFEIGFAFSYSHKRIKQVNSAIKNAFPDYEVLEKSMPGNLFLFNFFIFIAL